MILRILLLAALAFLAWRLWRVVQAQLARRGDDKPAVREEFEPMARCVRCGTYLPARSLSSDGLCGRCKQ